MDNIQISNNGLTNQQPIRHEENSRKLIPSFKAEQRPDAFVRQMSPQEQQMRAMQQYQKEQKRNKLKNNIMTGISAMSGIAMIAMVALLFKNARGSAVDEQKVKVLRKALEGVKDAGAKREAEEELARLPHERNLRRVEDIIELDKYASTVEEKVKPDIAGTKQKIDNDVIGMDEAKKEVVDYLQDIFYDVENKINDDKPLVLLFDGPPGTGKTTLAKAIADALGMYFKKVSLGGMKSGEEITGFARTYVGAKPGIIASGQLEAGNKRVFYCFDEAEKVAGSGPLDVLLPLLDKQKIFTDKYFNCNIDISQSMFALTTNDFKQLPEALRNRVRVINIAPYDNQTKAEIAKLHLGKALEKNKMTGKVNINDEIYQKIAELTEDQGGRHTSTQVDNLISAIKRRLNNGDSNVIVDNDFINRNLKLIKSEETDHTRTALIDQVGRRMLALMGMGPAA